jgi:hypothetical protein
VYRRAVALYTRLMVNQRLYLARVARGALVCSCVVATSLSVHAQEATEGAPTDPAASTEAVSSEAAVTTEAQVSTNAPGETIGEAASTSTPGASDDPAVVASGVVPPGVVPAATVSLPSGGFVQRLADTLNNQHATRVAPPIPNRDPRADLLDTSFPAEQPEVVESERSFGVNANVRPTQARTANGVTELSNRSDRLPEPAPVVNRAPLPKPPLSRPQVNTELNDSRLESQVSLRNTAITRPSSTTPWLWVLAGTAALLLIPIAFLLTRPTR